MKFNTYIMEDALEAIIDYRGKTPQKSESGIPTLSAKSVKNNFIDYNNCYYISQEEYNRFMVRGFPKKGDILLTTEAPLGMVAKLDRDDIAIAQRLLTLRGKNNILDNDYLLYFLQSSTGQHLLKSHETGTTVTGIKQAVFRKLEISIPNIEDQRKIATILSALDSRISINTAINENLEQQAQALFKAWFVDFEPFGGAMPDDWSIGTISDLSRDIICGKTPSTKKKEYYGDYMPFITIPDMHNNVYVIATERSLSEMGSDSQSKKTLPANSICVSCIGTAGLVTLVAVDSQTNQQINSIIPKERFSSYYIFLLMQTFSEKINRLGQSGSTIVNLNKAQFGLMEALVPSISDMNDFDTIVKPLFEQILANQYENQRLAVLRDTLLPKLMNGEIDVSAVKI